MESNAFWPISIQPWAMRRSVKQGEDSDSSGKPLPCRKSRMRAAVLIASDLPLHQIEIEMIAALLDDWECVQEEQPI